jgi:hypothetical protein
MTRHDTRTCGFAGRRGTVGNRVPEWSPAGANTVGNRVPEWSPVGANIGLGALEVVRASAGQVGRLIAVFSQAAYVRFRAGIVALTTTAVPSGPVHLRSDFPLRPLRQGQHIIAHDRWLQLPVWRGDLPDDQPCDATALRPIASRSALLQPPLTERAGPARHAVGRGDLDQAAALLGGLGPGLTPSGDDALAGLLLAARIRWSERAEPYLVGVAMQVQTHEISRQFVLWAARGQTIEPVHRWLRAGGEKAAAALASYGHTSGADLALGLLWGLDELPPDPVDATVTRMLSTARSVFDT